MKDKIRTSLNLNNSLLNKIIIFKKENNFTTNNSAIIRLVELGLIRYEEDNDMEKYLIQIIKQNNFIIKIIEEQNESKS